MCEKLRVLIFLLLLRAVGGFFPYIGREVNILRRVKKVENHRQLAVEALVFLIQNVKTMG